MNIAVIPARGGSKRIPKKNIREFLGKPIIAYSIDAALQSAIFDLVIVSTDSEEVASIARKYGADVPFMRPKNLSDDITTTVPVIKHCIEWVNDNVGNIKNVCCIYPTAPMIMASDLLESYKILLNGSVSGYIFSATNFPFPVQRTFHINEGGYVEMREPEKYFIRSQDLEPAYQDAAQFYWGSASTFMEEKIFFSTDSKAFLLPKNRVQDIDDLEDWAKAECMYISMIKSLSK